MAVASRVAERGRPSSRPNPAVGCVILEGDRVVARGWTQAKGRPHAEAHALGQLDRSMARESTIYVTLEPCAHQSERGPSCADLIVEAAPARVVVGQLDPDPRTAGAGLERLNAAGIEVAHLDDGFSRRSLAGYLASRALGRPYVTLKLAASLDGCIAMADGSSQWITGEIARAHVHSRRAKSDAILVGGGTWRIDQPRLDVRLPGIEDRSPSVVVLTGQNMPQGVRAISTPDGITELEDVQHLYVEGGAQTASGFFKADLVDEVHLYQAPIIIGNGLKALDDIGLQSLTQAHDRWTKAEHCQLGSDTFTSYLRTR